MAHENARFDTQAIHAGYAPDETGSRQVPIYQTSAYVFDDAADASDKFTLKKVGNVYSRLTNPTNTVLETRLAALEGGVGATVAASGHAGQLIALLALMQPGDNIVASNRLYGGTINQFKNTFRRHFGWECIFVDVDDPQNVAKAINAKTKAVYAESLANPGGVLTDIEALATIAHAANVPLIIDNTMASPALCRPIEWGADIVLHSTTKFLNGNCTAMGGVVIDAGKFDWKKAGKFPALTEPDPSYNGLVFADAFGPLALTMHGHAVGLRDLGPSQAPMNAFLTLNGIETLSLRMRQHSQNALQVAQYLEKHDQVAWVSYAGLPSSRYYALSQKYLKQGSGAVFTFGLKGGYDACVAFVEALKLFSMLANIGDTRSLVIHPASTTHSQLSEEHRQATGIGSEAIRVSIGIEDVADIIADLENAFASVKARRAA